MDRSLQDLLDSMEGVPELRTLQFTTMIAIVLRVGVSMAAVLAIAGYSLFLAHHPAHAPSIYAFSLPPDHGHVGLVELMQSSIKRHKARDIIDLGLMVLVITPVVRVAFSAVVFLYEGDYRFVAITLLVLAILTLAMCGFL